MPIQATRRMVTEGGLEVRSDSDTVTVEGYASTFGQPYDMGWYEETVRAGAFTKTLAEKPDVRFLINHDGLPLARTTSGTLELSQDTAGLHTRAVLDASDPDVQRVVPKMKRGDLNQMSFAFGIVKQEWSDDKRQRSLNELSLAGGDVSVVTYPANPNASIGMRMRALATDEPDRLRELYSEIVTGSADLPEGLAKRMLALLESLAVPEFAVPDAELGSLRNLLEPTEKKLSFILLAEDRSALEAKAGKSPQELRNLLALARRHK